MKEWIVLAYALWCEIKEARKTVVDAARKNKPSITGLFIGGLLFFMAIIFPFVVADWLDGTGKPPGILGGTIFFIMNVVWVIFIFRIYGRYRFLMKNSESNGDKK